VSKDEPMIIFTRTYDFISWLMPHTKNFPRWQRFVVTKRLQDAVLDFQERSLEANKLRGRARLERLREADAALHKVKVYLRLAWRWKWLSEKQYYFASQKAEELGRMLGGWIEQTSGGKKKQT